MNEKTIVYHSPQLATHLKSHEVMLITGEHENEIVLKSDLLIMNMLLLVFLAT